MVLSDRDIRKAIRDGRLFVDPYEDALVQPASIDLRLGSKFLIFRRTQQPFIDVRQSVEHFTEKVEIDSAIPFMLHPGEFALGVTLEEVHLPPDIVGRLDGKSSLGRLGLVVHSTAGFVDPGWKGNLTLELSNLANLPISLYYGMKVSQLSFMELTSPAENPYGSKGLGSKYQGQDGPMVSQFYRNYRADSIPVASARKRSSEVSTLRAWLQTSQYQGSVTLFANALNVPLKTVEDWVYGRSKPSLQHWSQLYEATGLPEYQQLLDTKG